ncbi:Ubiquinone biosynthesis protein COQ4-like [Gracilariopsis chorda]|uniref:Ubiquinone biosynthesis protein COQ4 homolog, mitochondrial n=1 Tax=Gracilariopsis chorda TaxID=448386 RepID=A0A2V3ILB7_9FLOR|nr:Ubiquinone biosynthesis protein COQ4-like [Gracilariopsis chorda]|eukprot:PXF42837.1 Ubiquinone biosynthesis protein COQ4-like [Gracilariopsis chorda]
MTAPLTPVGRALLTVGSALVTFANPARADTLAVLGDLTSGPALHHLTNRIKRSHEGRQMLQTLTPARFPEHGSGSLPELRALPAGTLGREYARFMDDRRFVPESRAVVRFVEDDTHRWVMQRYRDVHDLWHVLTAMPTTLLGETAQKLFEASQTGLPVTFLASVAGTARIGRKNRQILFSELVPWALSCGRGATDLLAIRYEDYLDRDLNELRTKWNITVPDVQLKGMKSRPSTKT